MFAVSKMRRWLAPLVAIAAIVVIVIMQAAISLADSVIHPTGIGLRAVQEEQRLIPHVSFEERWQLVYNSEAPDDSDMHGAGSGEVSYLGHAS